MTDDSARLDRLMDEQWAYDLAEFPELAFAVGEPQPGATWTDHSTDAVARRHERVRERLAAIESIDPQRLTDQRRLNHALFLRDSRIHEEGLQFPTHLLPVGQLSGAQQEVPLSLSDMSLESVDHVEMVLARLAAVPTLVDQTIELLRKGLATAIVPPRVTVATAPAQIDEVVTDDPLESGMAAVLGRLPSSIDPQTQKRLRQAATAVLARDVFPALVRLRDYLVETYVPGCRETIAIADLPDGAAWYRWRIRQQTSTDFDPETIHRIGHDELDRIAGAMAETMAQTGFGGRRDEFLHHIHHDTRFFAATPDDLVDKYRALCKRIDPELPRLFGTVPWLPYGVLPMPAHAERTAPAAYYLPGAVAAGRPGYFLANTYQLDQRPLWEMVPLALHEAVPGHHLQFALAQQMGDLHPWRRNLDETAFIEGWGLYAEGLGHDMGLYDDPFDAYGSLVFEAWRAARLVVDTGIHAMGWTRQEAIDFMAENTGKPGHDVEVEVDRYIAWPAQALAYTLGAIRFRELRRLASDNQTRLFDLRAFHDEVLRHGPLPLDVLESEVRSWIRRGAS
ncbi:MAG TPA: DUF885 domain-containing protein [Acidimicrobiales bacterium]|nr:DUF885 domain-containing protein [Acidimicrobiales bacterium]